MSLTPEQLEIRRTRVTATDATAIVGVNPWKNASAVWASKFAPPTEQNQRQKIGERAEAMVMDLLAEERELYLAPAPTVVDPLHTWLCATPDRYIVTRSDGTGKIQGVAEAKVVGLRVAHHWGDDGDEIPDYVRVQVQVQMTVTRTKLALVAALLGTELRIFEVEHEPDLEAAILEECERFHRHYLVPRVPPPPDASDGSRRAIEAAWPRNRLGMIAATPDFSTTAGEYLSAQADARAADERMEHAGNVLRASIGEHEGIDGFGFRATWKLRASGGVDWKAVAEELGAPADVIEKHRRPGSRVLLVKRT